MLTKPTSSAAFVAAAILFLNVAPQAAAQAPPPATPAAPAAPAAPVLMSLGTQNLLFGQAEAAFAAKDYPGALEKINKLLAALAGKKDPAYEVLYFYKGLAHLLSENPAEAQKAFTDCLKLYPKGEFTTRCYLGAGRACMLQGTPESQKQAIAALKLAAADPKFRSEAGLWLGQVYIDLGQREDAMRVFNSLMGADVRTPQQTTAAVEVIALLADSGKLEDLVAYLDQLSRQSGVRDAIAWYANQVIARGDELMQSNSFDSALAIYRSVPPRSQILETQSLALDSMRKEERILTERVKAEANKPIEQRSRAGDLLSNLKPAVELNAKAMKAIEDKPDLDAALLMRRGRCLYNLERLEEAMVCFRTLRLKYGSTQDAPAAAFAEIIILNKLKDIPQIKEKCDLYLTKYPNSDNAERVASLAGEVLVQSGKWKEVGSFFRNLEAKFPQSEGLERYVFFQALAFFMEGNIKESTPIFARFLKEFPNSSLFENAMYYMAMSNFLTNKYKETLASCKAYLDKFPTGHYAGDMHYRLAFIDFNDKEQDQCDKIIRELTSFLQDNPKDAANGSMLCLIGDTYKKRKSKNDEEAAANEDAALDAYKKAVLTDSLDDIMQYALDSATAIMQKKKDWAGIAAMHGEFMKRRPDSQLALTSASWVARMMARDGKSAEAAAILTNAIRARIANPASEQVEFLLDEIVKTLVPRKKAKDIDVDAIDKQLVEILNKVVVDQENATTSARIYYARARLAQALKRNDRSDLYLKGIATGNAQNPAALSPALLSVCGDILLKNGDLDGAEAMFQRLGERYKESIFSDAGPVGLGYVALARKQYEDALKIFDNALENIPGMSRFKEATLGKLQALVELNRFESAEKLGLSMVGDKMFRGEISAKAYMLLGQCYRKQAAKASGDAAAEWLKKAHAIYQRVYLTAGALPDLCAEGYWQAYESLKALGETDMANETLKVLSTNPKLQNTERAKQAAKLVQP